MDNTEIKPRRNRSLLFPSFLILLGAVLLLERSGILDRHTIWQLLPLVPIAIGVSLLASRLRHRAG
ncbi:hypothetical protein EGT07_01300 [Herbaspirillum sp. HC18]|nr:hypothetical protein EGT07_01300 [Herbaspirillum sp. HC18]